MLMEKKRGLKLRAWFKNRKLRYKFLFVYGLAGFVPIIAILIATYVQLRGILWEKEIENLDSYVYQAENAMDSELEIYNNLSNYISFNQSIAQVISSRNSSNYQIYDQMVTVIDPLLSSIMYFHSDVNAVTIYADGDLVKHGSTVAPLSEIEREPWFDEVLSDNEIHWYVDEKAGIAYSVCKMAMLDQYHVKGVLYLSIDYDSVFRPFRESLNNNYGVFITNQEGICVYQNSVFSGPNANDKLTYSEYLECRELEDCGYQFVEGSSKTTDWNIVVYKPDRLIISSMQPIEVIIVIAFAVSLIVCVLCIRIVSEFLTKRIARLQTNMRAVEKGNLSIEMKADSTDEIGELIEGFNNMVRKLDQSINEVYRSKIKEKEYEMRALQAQINPHFLYNSLSIINWKAIEAGEEDISKITLSLSTFYRTSLNKGKNVMPISDEVDNMRSYLNIQLIMHDNSFDSEIDIDPGIMKYMTLNLVLQPLIENAINHGIDVMPEGRGKITILGRQDEKEVYLRVLDNGVGMTEEQSQRIISEDSKGYGVRNVNERIKLFYGEQYALIIESTPGKGTSVTIHFPKNL